MIIPFDHHAITAHAVGRSSAASSAPFIDDWQPREISRGRGPSGS